MFERLNDVDVGTLVDVFVGCGLVDEGSVDRDETIEMERMI